MRMLKSFSEMLFVRVNNSTYKKKQLEATIAWRSRFFNFNH